MRYLSIWHPSRASAERPPRPEMIAEMNAFIDELTRQGILISTGGRIPSGDQFTMRNEHGEIRVVDGPYSETKEVVGGYALLELPSREAAIETCRRFLRIAGEGESELYLLMEPPPKA